MADIHDPTRLMRRLVLSGRSVLCAHRGAYADRTKDALCRAAALAGRDVQAISFGYALARHGSDPTQRRPLAPDEGEWFGLDAPGVHWGSDAEPSLSAQELWRRRALAGEPRPGHMLRARTGRPLSGPDAEYLASHAGLVDVRPDHDPAPALAGGGVVVVDCTDDTGLRYLHWLARACIDAAAAEGRLPPIVLGEADGVASIGSGLGWADTTRAGPAAILHPLGDRTVEGSDFGDDKAWLDLVGARLAAAERSRQGPVWTVCGGGRSVHVIRSGCGTYNPQHPDRESATVAEIGADGTLCGFRVFLHRRLDDADMADLADQCWLGGARHVEHRERRSVSELHGLMRTLVPNEMHDPGEIALRDILLGEFAPDVVAFLLAVGWSRDARLLQRWARPGGVPSRERMQFPVAYPSLAPLALDPEVTRLVDARRPPMARLCALIGAGPTVVRRFGVEQTPYAVLDKPCDWLALGSQLEAIGHGSLPGAGATYEWYSLANLLRSLRGLHRRPDDASVSARLAAMALRLPGRTWSARRKHFEALPKRDIRDVADLFRAIRHWFGALAGRDVELGDITLLEDYGTIDRALEASRRWHDHPALRRSPAGLPHDATWPVPFDTIALAGGNGFATCIGSVAAIVAEGARGPDADGLDGLSHCIAGYARSCLVGDCLVISFRRGVPNRHARLSTLELNPSPEGNWLIAGRPYRQSQHSGLGNAPPPREAIEMCAELRTRLAAGHPVDAAALDPRPEATGGLREKTGAELYPLWRPILPRRWARLGPAEIVAALDAEAGVGQNGAAA